MTILRKQAKEKYTSISNDVLTDKNLSFRARGVAAYLLTKPNGWRVKIGAIARDGKEGISAVRAALQELAIHGYMKRRREHDEKGFIVTTTMVADFPAYKDDGTPEERIKGISTDLSENRMTDNRDDGKCDGIVTTDTVTTDLVITEQLSQNQNFASAEPEPSSSLSQEVDFDMNRKKQREPTRPAKSKPSRPLPDPDPDYDPDPVWNSIPGAADGKPFVQGALVETSTWANQYSRQLDKAKDDVRRVSFLVYQHTGFEPSGTVQAWAQQVNKLWNAAKQDESLLLAGLKEGEEARRNPKNNLTFSGPRSYIAYVESAKSKLNRPKPVTLRRRKGGGRPNNQQVAINANGTVRVKL